jgi:hypothetical protein
MFNRLNDAEKKSMLKPIIDDEIVIQIELEKSLRDSSSHNSSKKSKNNNKKNNYNNNQHDQSQQHKAEENEDEEEECPCNAITTPLTPYNNNNNLNNNTQTQYTFTSVTQIPVNNNQQQHHQQQLNLTQIESLIEENSSHINRQSHDGENYDHEKLYLTYSLPSKNSTKSSKKDAIHECHTLNSEIPTLDGRNIRPKNKNNQNNHPRTPTKKYTQRSHTQKSSFYNNYNQDENYAADDNSESTTTTTPSNQNQRPRRSRSADNHDSRTPIVSASNPNYHYQSLNNNNNNNSNTNRFSPAHQNFLKKLGQQTTQNNNQSPKNNRKKNTNNRNSSNYNSSCKFEGDYNSHRNKNNDDDDDQNSKKEPCRRFNSTLNSLQQNQSSSSSQNNNRRGSRNSYKKSNGSGNHGGKSHKESEFADESMNDLLDNNEENEEEDVFIDEKLKNSRFVQSSIHSLEQNRTMLISELDDFNLKESERNQRQILNTLNFESDFNIENDEQNNLNQNNLNNQNMRQQQQNTLDITQPVDNRHALLFSSNKRNSSSSSSSSSSIKKSSTSSSLNSLKKNNSDKNIKGCCVSDEEYASCTEDIENNNQNSSNQNQNNANQQTNSNCVIQTNPNETTTINDLDAKKERLKQFKITIFVESYEDYSNYSVNNNSNNNLNMSNMDSLKEADPLLELTGISHLNTSQNFFENDDTNINNNPQVTSIGSSTSRITTQVRQLLLPNDDEFIFESNPNNYDQLISNNNNLSNLSSKPPLSSFPMGSNSSNNNFSNLSTSNIIQNCNLSTITELTNETFDSCSNRSRDRISNQHIIYNSDNNNQNQLRYGQQSNLTSANNNSNNFDAQSDLYDSNVTFRRGQRDNNQNNNSTNNSMQYANDVMSPITKMKSLLNSLISNASEIQIELTDGENKGKIIIRICTRNLTTLNHKKK